MKRAKNRNHEEEPPTGKSHATPVVGIGASAGGIDALLSFVPAVPKNPGLAFVVVQHLDSNHASHLSNILGRATSIPVSEIHDDTPIAPDHIYVIPPNTALS